MSVLVYSTGGKFEILPPSAVAILGEYAEDGENHGRKVYRRNPEAGQDTVILFYWDARDGKDLCGWWFGDQIGGGQVWARSPDASLSPPTKGWRCPVDGAANKHVVCVPKMRMKEEFGAAEPDVSSPVAYKRPAEVALPRPAKRSARSETYVLESTLGDKATKVVHKLAGEYIEDGENHGRKVFKKKTEESGASYVLYFWDQRDGRDCSGWWFSDSVGGAQVFARSNSQASTPPAKGWKIPHDGVVKTDVTLTPKGCAEDAELEDSERLSKVKELMAELDAKTEKVFETSRPVLSSKGDQMEEVVSAVYELLRAHIETLTDGRISVERHCKAASNQKASEEAQAELTLGEERIDALIGQVEKEMNKAKDNLQVVELGNASERDVKLLEKALHVAMDVVAQAESFMDIAVTKRDVVEAQNYAQAASQTVSKTLNNVGRYVPEAWKSVEADFSSLRDRCTSVDKRLNQLEKSLAIGASQASMSKGPPNAQAATASLPAVHAVVEQAEDAVQAAVNAFDERRGQMAHQDPLGRSSKRAADDIQVAADSAQESMAVARGLADGLARAAKQLPSIEQKTILDEIGALQKRMAEAQKKLNPHKKARSEFHQKLRAKHDTDEFDAEMAGVEAQVEKVVAVFSALPSEEEIREAEGALPGILTSLAEKMQAVEEKAVSAKGTSATVFATILGRAKMAMKKIDELKTSSKECRKQLKVRAILETAEVEVQKVEEWQDKMAKAEEPWAGNVEVVPEDIAKPALEACAALAEQAEPSVKASKGIVMEKLIDVRQVPEGPMRFEATEALMRHRAKIDQVALLVTQLKIDTYARKTKMLMPDVIIAVSDAEGKVQQVVAAAAPLDEDNLEVSGKDSDVKAACKATLNCIAPAAKECTSAHAVVESKKNDPKFGISPSFRTQLLKLEGRLETAEKEMARLQDAATNASKSKAIMKEKKKALEACRALVEEVDLAALPLGDEDPSTESNDRTAELFESTRTKLSEWQTAAEALAASVAHGALRHGLKRLSAQGVELQSALAMARKTAGNRLDRACCKIALREGRLHVKKAEEAMLKADQAEAPFLSGVEVISSEKSAKAIAQCEAAASAAQTEVDTGCEFFKKRRTELSRYTDDCSKDDAAAFAELSKQASKFRTKLTQFAKDTEHRKIGALN